MCMFLSSLMLTLLLLVPEPLPLLSLYHCSVNPHCHHPPLQLFQLTTITSTSSTTFASSRAQRPNAHHHRPASERHSPRGLTMKREGNQSYYCSRDLFTCHRGCGSSHGAPVTPGGTEGRAVPAAPEAVPDGGACPGGGTYRHLRRRYTLLPQIVQGEARRYIIAGSHLPCPHHCWLTPSLPTSLLVYTCSARS